MVTLGLDFTFVSLSMLDPNFGKIEIFILIFVLIKY